MTRFFPRWVARAGARRVLRGALLLPAALLLNLSLSPTVDAKGFTEEFPPGNTVLDNGDAGTSSVGEWKVKRAKKPYGIYAEYGRHSGSFTYSPALADGEFRIYMWVTGMRKLSRDVPITVSTTAGEQTVSVNQRANRKQWVFLGSYNLDSSSWVRLDVADKFRVCADAMRFEFVDPSSPPPPPPPPPPPDDPPPVSPQNLIATGESNAVRLDWTANTESDLASYSIYRSTTPGGSYTHIDSGVPSNSYRDTNVTNGTTYYYVITALDTAGNESSRSTEAFATPSVATGSATLSWVAPTTNEDGTPIDGDLKGFIILDGQESGRYTHETDTGNVTQFTISNLTSGTYFFSVIAYDFAGNRSALSAEVSKTITVTP